MNRTLVLTAALALAACGPSTSNYVQQQQPVTPTGTIYVRVVDGSTLQPMANVSAKVLGSDAALTSGADGVIVLEKAVVLSNYGFILDATGYIRLLVNVALPGTTGNSPLQNPVASTTVTMFKGDGEVKGVVLLPDGKPAANATVFVDQRNSGAGESVVSATAGADGTFDLKGLATRTTGFSHTVVAQWYDENADGQADYAAITQNVIVYPGSVGRMFMTYNSLGERIIATNIADAELAAGDDIKFTFALPILNGNLNGSQQKAFILNDVTATRNNAAANIAVDVTYAADGVNVSVKPSGGAQLVAGDVYQIAISVTQASAGGSNSAANFATNYTFQIRPSTATPITTQVTNLAVWNPNTSATVTQNQFNWNTNSFNLAWDGVPGILAYNVYAKDTNLNPGYVLITNVINNASPRVQINLGLPATFDANPVDGTAQPLSMKNKVTFAVVPVDFYGNWAPLASAPTVSVQDNIPPTTTTSTPTVLTPYGLNYPQNSYVDAINDDPTNTSTIQLRIAYSEPMDPTTQPTFTGSSAITATWQWDGTTSGSIQGTMTLTIAAGGDGTGPFIIRGGKDMAGNVLVNNDITGSLSGMKELLSGTSGNFEDSSGNCSMSGWSVSHTSTMPDPTVVPSSARIGRCAGFVGSPAGTAIATGSSKISQDVTLPTIPAGSNWSFVFHSAQRDIYQSPPVGGATLLQECRLTTNADATVGSTFFTNYNANQTAYTLSSGFLNPASFTGGVVRVVCEANNTSATSGVNGGMYIDDLSLTLLKIGTL